MRSLVFLLGFLSVATATLCPDLCKCDDKNLIVTCIKAGLEGVPNTLNPNVKTIVFKYNDLPTIHYSLHFLTQLVKVDLSHNKIVTISDRAFGSQKDLLQLKLENNKISQVSDQTFYGLPKLRVLLLRGNMIETLPENLFTHAKKLEELDLSKNRISAVHEAAFKGLSSLKILNLQDNEIPSIPVNALKHLPDLAELNLAGNPIQTVADGSFSFFQNLQSLDLSSCRLYLLEKSAFRGLGTVRQLRLADNNLSSVPADVFRHVTNLESLDIGRNSFPVIPGGAFRFLSKLKKLDMSGCGRLTAIEAEAFVNCVDLEHVTISLNRRLNTISSEAFDAMPNLKFFDLSENGITSVDETLLDWQNLHSLDVSGNPWQCDCRIKFLAELLQNLLAKQDELQRETNESPNPVLSLISDGKCIGPSHFRHRALSDAARDIECLDNEILIDADRHGGVNRQQLQDGGLVRRTGTSSNQGFLSSMPTVIIFVSVVIIVVVILSVLVMVVVRHRYRIQDWVKSLRWHQQSRRRDPACGMTGSRAKSALHDPYLRHQQDYLQPEYTCDDEHYYYVATMQNRMATTGKHIPVTEL